MSERDHDRRRDDVAAYLLGSLGPSEAADFEQHLVSCVECRTELDWLRPALNSLSESVERVKPPAALRTRIVGEARADAKAAAESARDSAPGFWSRFGLGSGGLRPALGLAALALIAAVVVGYTIRDEQTESTSTVVAGRSPGVTARVIRQGDSGTLDLANVQPLPPEEVLEAWVQRGGRVESAHSLFAADINGRASAPLPDMHGVEVVMVTAEPHGGSIHPTSKPIVTVPIPQ
jgi:anti-sigma-K factor RskA